MKDKIMINKIDQQLFKQNYFNIQFAMKIIMSHWNKWRVNNLNNQTRKLIYQNNYIKKVLSIKQMRLKTVLTQELLLK